MSYTVIDWATPAASLLAKMNTSYTSGLITTPVQPDPWGFGLIYQAMTEYGPLYDAEVSKVQAAVASGQGIGNIYGLTPSQLADQALSPTGALNTLTDLMTRLVAQCNIALAASFPWYGIAKPAGLVVGWPWI